MTDPTILYKGIEELGKHLPNAQTGLYAGNIDNGIIYGLVALIVGVLMIPTIPHVLNYIENRKIKRN